MTTLKKDEMKRTPIDLAELHQPAPFTKPLLFGAAAAAAGAGVWALLIILAHVEHGILAWGVGGAIGAAMVFGRARGQVLACSAAVLVLLAITGGKQLAFKTIIVNELDKRWPPVSQAEVDSLRVEADAWAKLGDNPTEAEVRAFAETHHYNFTSRDEFVNTEGALFRDLLAMNPTPEQWRAHQIAVAASGLSFIEYMKDDFHLLDIVFVVLGAATAFGMVSKATMADRMAVAQREIEAREAARAAQQKETEKV